MFALERAMLEARGHPILVYERRSDEIRVRGAMGILHGALVTPWNFATTVRVRKLVDQFCPQIVHVHNSFPLISPSVFPAVGSRAARVLTLHNYRLFCSAATPIRAGRVCTECLDNRSVWPAIQHGCYRGSRIATLPLAAGIALHRCRDTWQHDVEAFVALTSFQRRMMVNAGLPPNRVHVKPNFYPGTPLVIPWERRAQRVVFAGRLSVEKGVDHLISAWLAWGSDAPELAVVGDGPLRAVLEARRPSSDACRIRFVGQVDSSDAQRWIGEARLLIVPSVWFEGFPMVLREALALGTPCAVSNIGPLPEIVANGKAGAIFRPGDPMHLLDTVRALWADPARLQKMSLCGRREFETHYTEDANYERLMQIYEQAMSVQQARRAA